jgi:hypothetical protein
VLQTLTEDEQSARASALADARIREEEERRAAEAEAARRNTKEFKEQQEREAAEARKKAEEERHRAEEEAKARAEREANKRTEAAAKAAAAPAKAPITPARPRRWPPTAPTTTRHRAWCAVPAAVRRVRSSLRSLPRSLVRRSSAAALPFPPRSTPTTCVSARSPRSAAAPSV